MRLEEVTLGNLWFLTVSESKLLIRKTDEQGSEESYAPWFIMYVKGWLHNFPKITVGNWRSQVQKFGNTLMNWLFSLYFQLCPWQKNKDKKKTTYTTHPALEFALASQFTSNCESQQASHYQHVQVNKRNKINAIEFKISIHLSFDSS